MNTYQCEMCGETYEKRITDDEANAEAQTLFGIDSASSDPDMAIVCDDCFEQLKNTIPD